MAFDWREFIEVGRFVCGGSEDADFSQEAGERCAVSRAYFAAFCLTRNFAMKRFGFVPKYEPEDHTELRVLLQNKIRIRLAGCLNQLRFNRNYCDYEDREGEDFEKDTNAMYRDSDKIAQEVLGLLTW
jgi:hypothetical protein